MKISKPLADDAILAEIGERVARYRLDLQLTQAEVAEQAGVAKRTVERIEAGASAQMSNMIRIFRVLDLLSGLDRMIPEAGPRPMDLLRHKGKVRQRASKRRRSDRTDRPDKPWSWNDDT
ncbi:MAG TPA: XRE family transcriptional regulator [Acidiferrobacteraceae bacterium]|nr:XRE family transcriptional regulator [Acidiferrobacteraceae bacterium]